MVSFSTSLFWKNVIAEFTDAGPGEGVPNFEVTLRMTVPQLHRTLGA